MRERIALKIDILGVEYTLEERNEQTDNKLIGKDGYCDHTTKECIIDEMSSEDNNTLKKLSQYKQSVKRHEIIHAFLHESGLDCCCGWATEEMVDWLAIQFPKLLKVFENADCL